MPFNSPALQKLVVIAKGPKTQQLLNGDGAEAARAADNREDTGSKPVLRI